MNETTFQDLFDRLRAEVGKRIIGQHEVVRRLITVAARRAPVKIAAFMVVSAETHTTDASTIAVFTLVTATPAGIGLIVGEAGFGPVSLTATSALEGGLFAACVVGAVILGISPDSVASHRKFASKFDLPFTLLADVDHKVAEKYGAWREKNMYGKKSMGEQRSTFLIDAAGKVARVWKNVKVDGHDQQLLTVGSGRIPEQRLAIGRSQRDRARLGGMRHGHRGRPAGRRACPFHQVGGRDRLHPGLH